MRYLSICSGIEAASVAWGPLGWEPVAFAEVAPSACAVLQHHYDASRPQHMPDPMMADTPKDCLMRQAACEQVRRLRAGGSVPNLGDMTKIDGAKWRGKVDVLVGGTPCQAFSVAGLRGGLGDARGNLTLTFLELANAIEPAFTVWENVPGVLSDKTNAFGCLIGGLVGADDALQNLGGWPDRGVVRGPRRIAAWRVLDAQWFGLAQRRARVFVVACPRNGADPSEVLFERAGVQRHSAPRRKAGQGAAAYAAGRSHWSGGPHPSLNQSANGSGGVGSSNQELFSQQGAYLVPGDPQCITGPVTHALKADGFAGSEDGTGRGQPIVFQEVAGTLKACGGKSGTPNGAEEADKLVACFGGNNTSGPIDVATARNACQTASGRLDFETETFAVVGALRANAGPNTHGQSGMTCQQSVEAGHILPVVGALAAQSFSGGAGGRPEGATAGHFLPVAFHPTQDPISSEDGSTHALGCGSKGGTATCAVALRGRNGGGACEMGDDKAHALRASGGGGDKPHVLTAMQVRRLTPRECERLQGFPDDYTRIPVRRFAEPKITKNRPEDMWELIGGAWWLMMADGPRYKMLGNSMAVPCMRWIGLGIERANDMALPLLEGTNG